MSGCGYSSLNSNLTGQVKALMQRTPLLCGDRTDVDISLGVMRNGVGSMSTEDIVLTVPNREDVTLLKKASASGQLVNITYSVYRFTWCWNLHVVERVELAP